MKRFGAVILLSVFLSCSSDVETRLAEIEKEITAVNAELELQKELQAMQSGRYDNSTTYKFLNRKQDSLYKLRDSLMLTVK